MPSTNGYQVISTLMTSPSSCVYRGLRESDQHRVILRTCGETESISQGARLSSSFEILRSFDHPNIVKIIDLIEYAGQPCLVMDDSQSIDLWQYAESFEHKKLPLETVLNIAIQLAGALSVIHHAQVIHKDLHPGNVVIDPSTLNVQIIDFGLATLLSREQPALAPPENLEGILAYISPEQTGRMNRSLDYRSDFYTLGVTLYQLLTGTLPFEADDAIGLVHAHIARIQTPVCERCPEVPQAVSDIIDKLLYKTAETRYQSALGLKQDLDICRRHVLAGTDIPVFVLGLNDVSDRFQVPQVLYGREPEIKQLMASFYLAAKGQPQLLAVEGYAGIGKSALIHEVHKAIAAHSGIFTRGKFDQFQKNVPYSALKQVFSGWIQYALSLNNAALIALREQLINTLGGNARVLIDFLETFELVLGDLVPLPILGAQETQNRFHLVLQRFVHLVTHDRPLVIFIDDIQWADRGTLNLLPLLMGAGDNTDVLLDAGEMRPDCRLLLLVAYRDNEVDDTHPAITTLKQIRDDYDTATTLSLKPLSVENVNQLLVDALRQRFEITLPLAELVHHKTAGNPFFVNEFLKTLYSEKLLDFDLRQQQWCWSLDEIKAQAITNNVVELMLSKMQQLPTVTQHILQLASCIGSQFDLQTLSIISEQSMSETVRQLWPALKEGLLLQEGGDWLLGTTERQDNNLLKHHSDETSHNKRSISINTRMSPLVPQCRFLHDRMLQAAYQSLEECERQQAHLTIGRLLLAHTEVEQLDSQLFMIIEQLNQGRALILSGGECLTLAQMNLQAAEKAKQASVWEAAVQYASIGLEQLPDQHWHDYYDLSFGLYNVLAECEYLQGESEKSEQLYRILLTNTKSDLDKARLCATRVVQKIGRGQWEQGIDLGVSGLGYLGIDISTEPEKVNMLFQAQSEEFKQASEIISLNSFIGLPEMSDPCLLIASNIIPNLSQCGQILGRPKFQEYCTLLGLNITLKSGKSDFTPVLLACYANLLTKESEYGVAYRVAKLAINISNTYPYCKELANTYNTLAGLVIYLKSPYMEAISYHQLGYEVGLENGEIARAIISYSNLLFLKVSQGENLQTTHQYAMSAVVLGKIKSIFFPLPVLAEKLIASLTNSSSEGVYALDDDKFEAEYLAKVKSGFHVTILLHYRSQLAFWYDDFDLAIYSAQQIQLQIQLVPKFSFYIDHLLQYGLLLACKRGDQGDNRQHDLLYCLEKLQELAELYPSNFEHKYLLLQAEQGRYQNKGIELLAPLYEAAIESAGKNDFLQYEALANELYGAFLLSRKMSKLATGCLKEALYLYRRWGCTIKVNNLSLRYEELLIDQPRPQQHSEAHDSIHASLATLQKTSHASTQINTQEGLDLSSVMKSTQAISSELEIKSLVAKVMLAILENSGAQNGALILHTPQGARIQASLKTQPSNDINLETRSLENATDLPVSLISYVLRTDSDLILQDDMSAITSSANSAFIEDPYLQRHQPKSVLCIPVDYREKVIGALYLENPLIHNAFPQERFNIIKMLLAQAAISFENARLFNEVSELNAGLEDKVQRRTQELNQSNEELNDAVKELEEANKELDSFSYSVSHDLRAPLRTIKGFSNILMEDYAHSLEPEAQMVLKKVVTSANIMNGLITGLLDLSRIQKQALIRSDVPLSEMAEAIVKDLQSHDTSRHVRVNIQPDMRVDGDPRMLGSVLENLLNNAWKYSSKTAQPEISFTLQHIKGHNTFVVQDNGAGFDMARIDQLFVSFQRLHTDTEFTGTGVGLATVKRIINKHGGKIWAEAEKGKGATFYFTLG
ncbi:MAG: putative ATPase/signal transduction histidine kinase [Oleiphilaceae bacterium]|jgi:predicted ATPase/signal transduction histidine kinase